MKNKQDKKVKDNACGFIWLEIILAHYWESSISVKVSKLTLLTRELYSGQRQANAGSVSRPLSCCFRTRASSLCLRGIWCVLTYKTQNHGKGLLGRSEKLSEVVKLLQNLHKTTFSPSKFGTQGSSFCLWPQGWSQSRAERTHWVGEGPWAAISGSGWQGQKQKCPLSSPC